MNENLGLLGEASEGLGFGRICVMARDQAYI
jgi:hypothetical protein